MRGQAAAEQAVALELRARQRLLASRRAAISSCAGELGASGDASPGTARRPGRGRGRSSRGSGRGRSRQVVLDHPQRQVAVTLRGQDVAQPLDVVVGELAVAGGRSRSGSIRPSASRKRILEMRDVGELAAAAGRAPPRCS